MGTETSTLINVGGTSRSGSTLVHLILGNALDAFACGETVSWFRPEHTHHFEIDCPCGSHPCPIWNKISTASASRFYLTAFRELGVQYLVDSSKTLSWILDTHRWARNSDYAVVDVVVWKDPLDLAYSYWKRGHDLMFWRSQFVKYHRRVQQLNLPVIAINYGDLMQRPREITALLCAAIGMPDYEGKERFWEREHHHLFGSLGVRRQVEAGRSVFVSQQKFPDKFATKVDALNESINADNEVQQLIQYLKSVDVTEFGADLRRQPYRPPHVYPAWYFAQRLKRVYRRYYPATLSHARRGNDIETIPIKPADKGVTPINRKANLT